MSSFNRKYNERLSKKNGERAVSFGRPSLLGRPQLAVCTGITEEEEPEETTSLEQRNAVAEKKQILALRQQHWRKARPTTTTLTEEDEDAMEAEETQSVAPEDKGEKVSPASDEEVSAEGGEECADDSEGSSDEDEAEMGPIAIALRASPRSSRSSFSVMDEGVGAAEYPPSTDESPFSIVSNSSASPASCAVSPSPRATPVLLAGIPEASTSPASMKTYPTSCLKPNCAQPDAEQTVVKKPPVARRVSFSSALAFASAPVHQDKAGAASAELFS